MEKAQCVQPFHKAMEQHDLSLKRLETQTLQINTGLLCNQHCRHCHLSAGPDRVELMNQTTMNQIIDFQKRCGFNVVDITGGAPEMNPDLVYFIENISSHTNRLMLRSNLSALYERKDTSLIRTLKKHGVAIVSSFPALNASQTDSQRGKGIFEKSINALRLLNEYGWGKKNSGLELNLVSNPSGAFLPSSQAATEKRYRKVLKEKWNIVFNSAFTFANMPLGRFRTWLEKSGNHSSYIKDLAKNFNPCTIEGLMCRTLISVSWDGYLYDCDFNLATGIDIGNRKTHITDVTTCTFENNVIAVADHCYACTAGSGFT